jgi:hypothetical protein
VGSRALSVALQADRGAGSSQSPDNHTGKYDCVNYILC